LTREKTKTYERIFYCFDKDSVDEIIPMIKKEKNQHVYRDVMILVVIEVRHVLHFEKKQNAFDVNGYSGSFLL